MGKNDKPGRELRTRSEKSTIEYHDDHIKKLEAERAKLEQTKEQGMFTEDDDKRLSAIDVELNKYASTMAQMKVNPTARLESTAAAEQHATEPDTTEPIVAGPNRTEPNANEPNAAEPNMAANAPDPVTAHANAQKSPSNHREIKRERTEESKVTTNRLVDDLGMAWDVDVSGTHVEPSLQNQHKEAIGHIMRTSQARYCVGYGSADARSARFESSLPHGSRYRGTRDVTKRSNRIVERIVQFHKDKKEPLPMDILSRVKVLLVYWDSKMGIGHAAEVDVLAPDFDKRRPHTRCFVYLDPELYAKYDLENKTGYSHETRSTMKPLMEGNDDWQKSITLHNIAVRLENKFEEKYMSGVLGRPEPLRELVHESKVVSRRTRSPYASAEPAASPTPQKLSISPRQPTPLPETRHKQAPTGAKPGMSLKQQFHMDFLELFDLAESVTYADLTEKQQLLYPAQFTKWKAVNS